HRRLSRGPARVRDARRSGAAVRAAHRPRPRAPRLVPRARAVQAGLRAGGALREVRARRERSPDPRAVRRARPAAGSSGEGAHRVKLEGKVALVTGASRGIGRAVAIALAEKGCAVACAARATDAAPVRLPGTIDETVRAVEAAGGAALAVPTNLAVEDEVVAMVRATEQHFGKLDVLVNNAAITFIGDLDIPQKRHDLVMTVNY